MMTTKIIVVTHKEYEMPEEKIYVPICVGPGKDSLRYKYLADDIGDNISDKNPSYCEMTALYWAWKNIECDIFGMVHYRRYFVDGNKKKKEYIINEKQILKELKEYDAIVAKHRTYFESLKTHYIKCQKGQEKEAKRQIEIIGEVIKELSPNYYKEYIRHMQGNTGHMFNMFIMKKSDADAFCSWIYPILFEAERRIWNEHVEHDRIMGGLSEFLLDTWLNVNKKKIKEKYVVDYGYSLIKKIKFVLYRRLFGKVVK